MLSDILKREQVISYNFYYNAFVGSNECVQ